MSDAKRIADRYIGRDGGPPVASSAPPEGSTEPARDITAVACFLAWQPPTTQWGSYTADQALRAFCRLHRIDPDYIRHLLMAKSLT